MNKKGIWAKSVFDIPIKRKKKSVAVSAMNLGRDEFKYSKHTLHNFKTTTKKQ